MLSYPFTSQVTYDDYGQPLYDRAVDSEFLRKVFLQYFSDGVFYKPTNALQVVVDTGMQVAVEPGACHIRGAMGIEESRRTLVVQASEEQDRIDTVVARLDLSTAVRSIDLYVVKGIAAVSPQAPELTRDATVWEIGLANIFVAKNTATISQQRITDTRLDTARCGIVVQTIGDVDTAPYFSQLAAAIAIHQEEAEAQIQVLKDAIAAVEGDTAWMMQALYDPQGRKTDIFKYIDSTALLISSGAGFHNGVYGGRHLGDSVTEAQYSAIKAGTFDDLFIGDYWTIGGVDYRIAAFDYYLKSGDENKDTHHVVLVPDQCLYSAQMNGTNSTDGAYVGSYMYRAGLNQAKDTIKAAFPGHVLSHNAFLQSGMSNGIPVTGEWKTSEVDLMCEIMVFGSLVLAPTSDGNVIPANTFVEKGQLPLFGLNPSLLSNRQTWWLRDPVSPYHFSVVGDRGMSNFGPASSSFGVRPSFCITG